MQLYVPKFQWMHWSPDRRWKIAESLAYKVSETTNSFLKQTSFIFASTLEVTTFDYKPWLSFHLPLVVRMFGQNYYSLENFPYKEAIDSWKNAVKVGRHGDV